MKGTASPSLSFWPADEVISPSKPLGFFDRRTSASRRSISLQPSSNFALWFWSFPLQDPLGFEYDDGKFSRIGG